MSCDERSQDGSSSGGGCGSSNGNKKMRVFFTEEQKEVLRVAYATDPYPSPGRIDELAAQITVGTKTIVNWFHNHRMRAKQQPLNSNKPDSSSEETMADTPSASGSPTYRSEPPVSQWMFPTFEAVAPRSGSAGVEELDDKMAKIEADQSNNNKPTAVLEESTRKNRRKSSRPKWVYEGIALENAAQGESSADDEDGDDVISNGVENLKYTPASEDDDPTDKKPTVAEELAAATTINHDDDRLDNIAKLSENINRCSAEDDEWEF